MIGRPHIERMDSFPPERAERLLLPSVREMGFLAEAILRRGRRGRVVAVFESSFYAVFDSDWICVGLSHFGSGPLHVVCDSRPYN